MLPMAPEETHGKGTKCFMMVAGCLADFLGSASAPQHHSVPKPKKRGTQPQKNCPHRKEGHGQQGDRKEHKYSAKVPPSRELTNTKRLQICKGLFFAHPQKPKYLYAVVLWNIYCISGQKA